MRSRWVVGVIVLVAACGSPAGQPAAQTSASSTRIESPVAAYPLATVDFSCVLPVYGGSGSAFISFPSRGRTAATETGYYFDRAVSRWVPVYRQAVSPDGRRYAYTDGWSASPPANPRLHIVDVATRAELRVATMPDAQPYQVADFTAAGVYLIVSFEGTAPGVWLFDPATAGMTKVSNGFYPPAGPAWIGVVDPRDPNPQRSTMTGAAEWDRIDRREGTALTTTWFYKPGYALSWVAFAGSPAILVDAWRQDSPNGQFQETFWLVDGPDHAKQLTPTGDTAQLLSGFGTAIADSHGIWIGGPSALFLARPDGTILRVLDGTVYPANGCF
jgi:hypothetical protein